MASPEVEKVLEDIGLTKNEIKIYLILLQHGKSSAITISKRTGVHRPNVYDNVEKLIERGIVFQTIEENRKVFNPISPRNLLRYIKQKEQDLINILPEIESLEIKEQHENLVTSAEGLNAVRTAIFGLLETKEEILMQGLPIETQQLLGGFIVGFHNERKKGNIVSKQLYPEYIIEEIKITKITKIDELKSYPEKKEEKTSIMISGDNVVIISWDKLILAVSIKNQPIAEKFRNNFLELWRKSKEIK
jgi:sugar-specific transcriptional regulator TrmB